MGLFVPLSLVFLKRCCCCLQFCKIHLVAGIFVLCSFSLCLASDALLEFFWEFSKSNLVLELKLRVLNKDWDICGWVSFAAVTLLLLRVVSSKLLSK